MVIDEMNARMKRSISPPFKTEESKRDERKKSKTETENLKQLQIVYSFILQNLLNQNRRNLDGRQYMVRAKFEEILFLIGNKSSRANNIAFVCLCWYDMYVVDILLAVAVGM